MNITKSLAITIFIIVSCNVQSIRKARLQNSAEKQQSAQVDSFLYYQPVTLNDAFLDSLKAGNDSAQTLKIRIVPPPAPPAPKFKQVEGYRVQTFAGIDSLNALVLVNQLRSALDDSVYFFKERELFKIQLGDFLYRNDADMKVMDLRKNGFQGAWVVQRLINVPIDTTKLTAHPEQNLEYPFKIQVLVTSDKEKAKALVNQLKNQFNMESFYTQNQQLYKIFVGKFATREEAEKILSQIRAEGYQDAWLVKNK